MLAIEVVIAHGAYIAGYVITAPGIPPYITAVPGFLAISGFLVLKSREQSSTLWEYALKRVLRLGPALIVSITICWVLYGPLMASNSLIVWLTGGLPLIPIAGPANGPLWSLLWEEIAYLLLAVLWLWGAYRRPLVIWVLLVVSLVTSRLLNEPSLVVIELLPIAFLTGNLMYLYRRPLARVHWIIPTAFAVIMLVWGQNYAATLLGPYSWAAEGILLAQIVPMLWFCIAGPPSLIRWGLPDISYGLYAYHWPVLSFVFGFFTALSPVNAALVGAAVLLPLTVASWYLIEKPILRLGKRMPRLNFGRSRG